MSLGRSPAQGRVPHASVAFIRVTAPEAETFPASLGTLDAATVPTWVSP